VRISNDKKNISEEEKERILNPFLCVKGEIAEKSVRLALCKSIIEGHGGSLKVKNGMNDDGSSFIIKIPILIQEKI